MRQYASHSVCRAAKAVPWGIWHPSVMQFYSGPPMHFLSGVDNTPMDFVVFAVTKVFHRSTEDALALTLAVHTQGKGIAGTYTFEVAEQKQCEVLLMAKIEEHPLRVEVERA